MHDRNIMIIAPVEWGKGRVNYHGLKDSEINWGFTSSRSAPLSLSSESESIRATLFFLFDILLVNEIPWLSQFLLS